MGWWEGQELGHNDLLERLVGMPIVSSVVGWTYIYIYIDWTSPSCFSQIEFDGLIKPCIQILYSLRYCQITPC